MRVQGQTPIKNAPPLEFKDKPLPKIHHHWSSRTNPYQKCTTTGVQGQAPTKNAPPLEFKDKPWSSRTRPYQKCTTTGVQGQGPTKNAPLEFKDKALPKMHQRWLCPPTNTSIGEHTSSSFLSLVKYLCKHGRAPPPRGETS